MGRWAWGWILGLGGLFVALHWWFFFRTFKRSLHEWGGDWSHALIVPLISAYFVYQNAEKLASLSRRVFWPGLAIMLAGILSFIWWIEPGRNDMFQGYSMIITLFGLVLFLLGPTMMRVLWFPIAYLAVGVKVSERIWDQVAWKLQLIAAQAATIVLQLLGQVLGIDASVQGSTIKLSFMRNGAWVNESLNVAEACSGLRMLMAFVALGLAMAYLVDRPWWHRMVMLLLIVPIAIAVNVGRVSATGLIYMIDPAMASGDLHKFIGLVMLIPAAGLFWLLTWVLDHVVIRDAHPPSVRPRTAAGGAAAAQAKGLVAAGFDRARAGRLAGGAALGCAVTLLIGVVFGLALAVYRPQDVFGGWLTSPIAKGLFIVGVALLVGVVVAVRRMVLPESKPNRGPGPVALGLAIGVLFAATAGLQAAVKLTGVVVYKLPVSLRKPLYLIPDRIGNWKLLHEDPPLSEEMVETLGTKQYLSRVYADANDPRSIMRIHVAYYTGIPDTVPHVPDRCYVAGGVQPISTDGMLLTIAGPQYRPTPAGQWESPSILNPAGVRLPKDKIEATIFTYALADQALTERHVFYFFSANGKFLSTPDLVRLNGFDPRDRHSYYCKVEVEPLGVGDALAAAVRVSEFLSTMLPEILACLPDWVDVQEGRWPKTGG